MRYSELPPWLQAKVRANTLREESQLYLAKMIELDNPIGLFFFFDNSPEKEDYWNNIAYKRIIPKQ